MVRALQRVAIGPRNQTLRVVLQVAEQEAQRVLDEAALATPPSPAWKKSTSGERRKSS
jgi:hypothetical protein